MMEIARIRELLNTPQPVVWLFTGDSITHGALHTHGWRSYPEHFAERVRWELQRMRDVVINTGISGDTVRGLLEDVSHRVLRFEPDVVSIMIGMNDAADGPAGRSEFQSAYRTLLDWLRKETRCPLWLHTPNPVTPAETRRTDLPAYVEIVRTVAAEYDAVLLDHDRLWRQMSVPLERLLDDGELHPNHLGHTLMARYCFQALGIFDAGAPTCQLFNDVLV